MFQKMEIVRNEGGREVASEVGFYGLDAINATHFSKRFTEAPSNHLVVSRISRARFNALREVRMET